MNDERVFRQGNRDEIRRQGGSDSFRALTRKWIEESAKTRYSYHFEWLGRPIIQYPQDMIGTQQLLWEVKPDLVIETGIARGGSLIFYASMLELISQCGGPEASMVLGIDIDIRNHNREAILSHPMSKRIEMIQGSSIDKAVAQQVQNRAQSSKKVMIFLDSNHTHSHVLQELQLYAPLVSLGSYIVVFDTVVEDLPSDLFSHRPWSKGDNPKTAVIEYLKDLSKNHVTAIDGAQLNFIVDDNLENQLMITVAPSGFLKRV